MKSNLKSGVHQSLSLKVYQKVLSKFSDFFKYFTIFTDFLNEERANLLLTTLSGLVVLFEIRLAILTLKSIMITIPLWPRGKNFGTQNVQIMINVAISHHFIQFFRWIRVHSFIFWFLFSDSLQLSSQWFNMTLLMSDFILNNLDSFLCCLLKNNGKHNGRRRNMQRRNSMGVWMDVSRINAAVAPPPEITWAKWIYN